MEKKANFKFDENLLKAIEEIFYNKRTKYGYRRIHVELQRERGIYLNINTIYHYYKHLGLKTTIRQKRKNCEQKDLNANYNDLIKRNFKANVPFKKLFTDVIYIKTKSGWTYLSVVLDGFNNEI